jgi:RimJ/RimL family protein N-acetyltransferase
VQLHFLLRPVDPGSFDHVAYLYAILYRRMSEPKFNISHRRMPTLRQHWAFLKSRPYEQHYLIMSGEVLLGACYVSHHDEVGIWLSTEHRRSGLGSHILDQIIKRRGRQRLIANVAKTNLPSLMFFLRNGFVLLPEEPEQFVLEHYG